MRQQILGRLQPGQVVEGKISNIVDFGAFVDLDGIDGLIHISELSWSHVNHPSEVLSIGDTVRVKVLDIDRDRQRISLGLKQTQEDPWQRVLDSYGPGDILEGKVTKVVAFGAFVEIVPGVEGLVHISELANHHVESPGEVASPGDEVRVKILEIDEERRRISLSIKRVEGQGLRCATSRCQSPSRRRMGPRRRFRISPSPRRCSSPRPRWREQTARKRQPPARRLPATPSRPPARALRPPARARGTTISRWRRPSSA